MYSRQKWASLLLILPLLISGFSPTPFGADSPAQTVPTHLLIWCPDNVGTPQPNQNGCTDAFLTMSELSGSLAARNPAGNGTIWIGKDYNSFDIGDGIRFLFDGTSLTNMSQSSLTFNGGWDGLGTGTLDPNHPSIFDGSSLAISNWVGTVSLRNLMIRYVSETRCSAPTALCVSTEGNIELDHVQVWASRSGLRGAYLMNGSAESSKLLSVTVANSRFAHNGGTGLEINSPGTITLRDNSVQNNIGIGVHVYGRSSNHEVYLLGVNTFLKNGSEGLYVTAVEHIVVDHLRAYYNGLNNNKNGAYLAAAKSVTIRGSGRFKENGANGLQVYSDGVIIAQHLTAADNFGNGFSFTSDSSLLDESITLYDVNADSNAQSGIELFTYGGISLTCSVAYDNGKHGLYVRDAGKTGPAGDLYLLGFFSDSNALADEAYAANVYSRANCPDGAP